MKAELSVMRREHRAAHSDPPPGFAVEETNLAVARAKIADYIAHCHSGLCDGPKRTHHRNSSRISRRVHGERNCQPDGVPGRTNKFATE